MVDSMENVSNRLRELRKSATPRVTVRALAAELDMPLGTYSFYETPTKYKKATLPLNLTRRIASILAKHNVDPAEVMKLAGLSGDEVRPEAREIEAAQPRAHYFFAKVELPSEAALAAMLEPLLALIPPEASRAEAARILAQRLPAGFAAIGPGAIELDSDQPPAPAAHPLVPATARHAPKPRSRN